MFSSIFKQENLFHLNECLQGSNRVEIQCRAELDEPLGHVKVS
jgi:hypothetical protein